jgi:type I restriction enzyme M protein
MTNNTASIVSKVWSFCTTLRDDGVSYGDYLEQLRDKEITNLPF